jgi:hypothetical protein
LVSPLSRPGLEEDFQAWEMFKNKPFRWLFNKLEVALNQDLHAGPAAVAPVHSGIYIHRPIYNLYGMGIGATKFAYDADHDYDDFINHAVVPPGHFWCEWIHGEHISIDYQQYSDGEWRIRSVLLGEHYDDDNLTKFNHWRKVSHEYAPAFQDTGLLDIIGLDPYAPYCNIEMRGDYVVEVHLRLGNDPFDHLPIGAKIIPVWDNEEAPEGEWMGNLHNDMEQYSASGNLTNIRRGYVIQYPK